MSLADFKAELKRELARKVDEARPPHRCTWRAAWELGLKRMSPAESEAHAEVQRLIDDGEEYRSDYILLQDQDLADHFDWSGGQR
jgi:hypothetical protein